MYKHGNDAKYLRLHTTNWRKR